MKLRDNIKKILIVIATLIFLGLLIYFAGPVVIRAAIYVFRLFSPFIFGFLLSRLINPVADRLQNRLKIPRGASAAMVVILTIAVLIGIIGGVGYKLFDEIKNLYYQWPSMMASFQNGWNNLSAMLSDLYIDMPDSVQNMVDNLYNNLTNQMSQFMSNIEVVNNAQDFARSLPGGFIWTIVFVIAMFFMVSQKSNIDRSIKRFLGPKKVAKLTEINNECRKYLGGYVRAQIILMFIIFVVIAIALSILGAPYSLLVAAATAILDALPFLGSGITLWPLAVIYFINGNLKLGIGYVCVYIAVALLRRFIEPKLVSDKMGLNPILTLVAMYIGYRWWGILGMLIGPIILMVIISLYKAGLFNGIIKIIKQLWGFAVREVKLFIDYINNILNK
ncbi:MAG TPA: sporulation integral membrane protein YtvI [Candidatus Ornithomonoglobus merdipullorum]|uniref:Sporulation integral membrane protein YtvI n=1 Tax=Candidatus Ornithomonoglobus merdipullorum TaxID=2840895 RepID=A0A9D1SES2_9FIRM|nr:sporulation integral membrane protein YtvI [Candidatus Ornithomonoglobus merdipullorum]